MRDYPIDHQKLHHFSQGLPYGLPAKREALLEKLNQIKVELNFPAITNDVGSLLQLLLKQTGAQNIFEFGSGYGHSLFWYCELPQLTKIVLTEKRDDLESIFNKISWPENVKQVVEYFNGDAFERFCADSEEYDFILLDGVKSSYLEFLELALKRLTPKGLIAIDNSYWRGSFLDPNMQMKDSAKAIAKLHQYISELDGYEKVFLPFIDGLTLIQRKSE